MKKQQKTKRKTVKKGNENLLVSCPYFNVSVIEVSGEEKTLVSDESFAAFTVTEGSGTVISSDETVAVSKGSTVFAFAGAGEITFKGNMQVVRSTL